MFWSISYYRQPIDKIAYDFGLFSGKSTSFLSTICSAEILTFCLQSDIIYIALETFNYFPSRTFAPTKYIFWSLANAKNTIIKLACSCPCVSRSVFFFQFYQVILTFILWLLKMDVKSKINLGMRHAWRNLPFS